MNTCTDPWDPVVMRTSENAHLEIPVMSNVTWDNLKSSKSTKVFALTNKNVVSEKYSRLKRFFFHHVISSFQLNLYFFSLHGSLLDKIDENEIKSAEGSETAYHDISWCPKSEYLIICGTAVTRNVKSFVADNQFEEFRQITHPSHKTDDLCVSLLVGSLLMEAKHKILSKKKS